MPAFGTWALRRRFANLVLPGATQGRPALEQRLVAAPNPPDAPVMRMTDDMRRLHQEKVMGRPSRGAQANPPLARRT